MALLDYITKGRGVLGDRTSAPLPSWAQSMYPGGAPGTVPGNPGSYPGPAPVNAGGAGFSGRPMQTYPGDDRGGGMNGGGGGQGGSPNFSMQDILNSQQGIQNHGYFDLPKQFFDPKEMMIGGAVSQAPLGGMIANMGGAIGSAFMGHPRNNTDIARGFASSLPGVGAGMKLSEWYAGTPYAKNHPIGSYYMGGNADQEAAKYTDSAYRSGFGANQMQSLYDAIAAQKNLGGAGNVQNAINSWSKANFNDGQIHIGEEMLPNPYAVSAESVYGPLSIDNSGQGVTGADQVGSGWDLSGATNQAGSPVEVTTGQQPGGPTLDQAIAEMMGGDTGAGGGGGK